MKITPSMVALWHTVVTVATGILVPIIMGLFQYVSQHGVNVGQDVSYSIPVLLAGAATLQVSLWHAIKLSPALPQVEADVQAQATPIVTTAIGQVGAFVKEEINALESRLHIHINNAVQAATPASVPQVPFPPQASASGNMTILNPNPGTASQYGSYIPVSIAGTVPPQNMVSLPQRSFTESALMPAVPKQ
jgi:hypothetical protein